MSAVTSGYGGVVAAMLTPCREPGIPDPGGMMRLAHILIEQGCHGLFVLSSTGELPLLDEDQRRVLVAAAREGAGEKAKIYAGISGCGAKQAIRYAGNAEKDGADVAVIMAPFFLKISQEGLIEYIRQIADASPIPVGMYSHFRMPSAFETETIMRLAQHPNIVAIKDTGSDLGRTIELAHKLRGLPISFFQGREPFLYESFTAGAHGCVSALANIAPETHRQLYDAIGKGDIDEARNCQKKIDSLARIFQLDKTKTSFAGFGYSIRKIAQFRGWLDHTDGMMPGFRGDDSFDRQLLDIASETGLIGKH